MNYPFYLFDFTHLLKQPKTQTRYCLLMDRTICTAKSFVISPKTKVRRGLWNNNKSRVNPPLFEIHNSAVTTELWHHAAAFHWISWDVDSDTAEPLIHLTEVQGLYVF